MALDSLERLPDLLAAREWPGHLSERVRHPGLYAWWIDEAGADQLTNGLGMPITGGRIYAGQAGATKWPSGSVGKATLRSRIGSQHLGGRIRSSTFRFTLASTLCESLGLTVVGPKKLLPESEDRLSSWAQDHLRLAVHPVDNRDVLADLEDRVLEILDPPLNLEGRPPSVLRSSLSRLRYSLGQGQTETSEPPHMASKLAIVSEPQMEPAAGESERGTLHEEIAAILREKGGWMTTQEIADEVGRRGRYVKKDGSSMTAFQIHGRTRNYGHLFERDGSRVRLKD